LAAAFSRREHSGKNEGASVSEVCELCFRCVDGVKARTACTGVRRFEALRSHAGVTAADRSGHGGYANGNDNRIHITSEPLMV
jgi:hypothetical protein